ncbi:stalk domain-containing protein [Paenibacillus methanolicus]|uniref:Copper amine oxidase-like protein n=1 Tax=Paenibacillus methanolicus TaxID=582686 RepID=A0A5S5C1N9_9BACL|nr:copper amine oxidase N-terminal domain-containing protein [Paenibacillus methanolicus]TYP73217.1 copper amine oxidase-like protein [Paenibacillus methanolicus]
MKKRMVSLMVTSAFALQAAASVSAAPVGGTIQDYEPNAIVKKNGTFWNWGVWGIAQRAVPTQVNALSGVKKAFPNRLVLKQDNTVWQWTIAPQTGKATVTQVPGVSGLAFSVSSGDLIYIVDGAGAVYAIPYDSVTHEPLPSQVAKVAGLEGVTDISRYSESDATQWREQWLFLKKDGTVQRKLKDETTAKPVAGLSGIVDLQDNFALKNDGTVWGLPAEVANSDRNPRQVKGLTDIQSFNAAVAIDGNSQLWYWGNTVTGWSDTTARHRQSPIRITTINDVKAAFAVERALLVLTNSGKLYMTSIEMEKLPANPSFKLIASDVDNAEPEYRHLFFQKTDGSLWGVGINKNSELGYGDFEFEHWTPVPVQKPIEVVLNDEAVELTNGVVSRSNQTFVPLRSIFEKLGAKITWNAAEKLVTLEGGAQASDPLKITINYTTGITTLNGKAVDTGTPPFSLAGTSYLPLRFVSEQLGAKVDWNQQEEKINITYK